MDGANEILLLLLYRHVGHIGYTPEKGFSIENNDPEWNGVFEQLRSLGITADEINQNQDFIHEFLQQHKGSAPTKRTTGTPPPPPPPSRGRTTSTKKTPPPPPPPPSSKCIIYMNHYYILIFYHRSSCTSTTSTTKTYCKWS